MKLRNLERSEIEICHVCDMFAQFANVFVLDAGERQMWRIGPILFGNAERPQGVFDPACQFGERREPA